MNLPTPSGKRESGKAETYNCQAGGMAAFVLVQPQPVAARTARVNCKTIRCGNGARPSPGAARLTGVVWPCLLRLPKAFFSHYCAGPTARDEAPPPLSLAPGFSPVTTGNPDDQTVSTVSAPHRPISSSARSRTTDSRPTLWSAVASAARHRFRLAWSRSKWFASRKCRRTFFVAAEVTRLWLILPSTTRLTTPSDLS